MKLDKNTTELISELEYIIGNECYNPNSYDGYTGEEGKEFRYPVNVRQNNKFHKYRYKISSLNPNEVSSIRYHFGSNHLYIGKGLIKVLKFLEDRYDIDFNELESIRKK